jgi:DNA invertase Pin-like site-specific DNA recombinase
VQGIFTLQVLGAAAELERALIRERTRAGLR